MYTLKVAKTTPDKEKILRAMDFPNFEKALAAICTKTIFHGLHDESDNPIEKTLGDPTLYCTSENNDSIGDAFEFRYDNGITVYMLNKQ